MCITLWDIKKTCKNILAPIKKWNRENILRILCYLCVQSQISGIWKNAQIVSKRQII